MNLLPYALRPTPYTLGAAADLGDGLTLMIVGMLVVFVSLVVLLGIIVALNRLMPSLPAPEATSTLSPVPASATLGSTPGSGIPPHHLAVIAAAAAVVFDGPVRVTAVRPH